MALIFKECPIDLGDQLGPILCENVKVTILDIICVNKKHITFSAVFEFDINNQFQRKILTFTIEHIMIDGNPYQQGYENLKKKFNSKGYANI